LRLLFIREFALADVLLLWDALFADLFRTQQIDALVPHICLSMLIYMRENRVHHPLPINYFSLKSVLFAAFLIMPSSILAFHDLLGFVHTLSNRKMETAGAVC
jgi:hypothetical protein